MRSLILLFALWINQADVEKVPVVHLSSGFPVAKHLIVTCNHVISHGSKVKFYSGKEVEGKVIKVDEENDLALVEVTEDLVPFEFGGPVELDQDLRIIGHPNQHYWTTTRASVSSLKPSVSVDKKNNPHGIFQIHLGLAPGCSGGPVLNKEGKVVGMSWAYDPVASQGFIIPARTIQRFLQK